MTSVPSATTEVVRREFNLRQVELAITRKLDGLLLGEHQAILRGSGSEAGEGRPYAPGDDARRIDWALTARSSELHVRDTIADRELETWLCVDASASPRLGHCGVGEARPRDHRSGGVRVAGGEGRQPHRSADLRRVLHPDRRAACRA